MRNGSVDTLKLLCALLVIFLHVPFVYGCYIEPISRIAVPIFLMISGYYCSPLYIEETNIRKLKKIIKIFICSLCFYGIWGIIDSWHIGVGNKEVISFIFFNNVPNVYHLWYLPAYIYVICLTPLLLKFKKFPCLSVIVVAIGLNLFLGKYSGFFFNKNFYSFYTRNFLLTGIPYFLIGLCLKKFDMEKIRLHALFCGGIFLIVSSEIEAMLLSGFQNAHDGDIYISTTPLAMVVFLCSLKFRTTSNNIFAVGGRNYSLLVYILHLFVAIMLQNYLESSVLYHYLAPFVVFSITLIMSILVLKLYNKVKTNVT